MLRRAAGWLVISLAVALLSSTMLAYAPARVRLLFLVSLTFGLGIGWILGLLAGELDVKCPRSVALGAALLVIIGLANVARLDFGRLEAGARQRVQENSQELIGLRLLEGVDDGERHEQELQKHRLRLEPGFGDYLAARISALGWYAAPWPEVIWGLELSLAGLAGGWTARRRLQAAMQQADRHATPSEKKQVEP